IHPSPEEQVAAIHDGRFWRERLVRALAALPERERVIVCRRPLAGARVSLEIVAREVGLSKERVRQIEARALARIERKSGRVGNECVGTGRSRWSPGHAKK